jgi:hypothetical protein
MRLTINILLSISFVTISHFINLDKQLIFSLTFRRQRLVLLFIPIDLRITKILIELMDFASYILMEFIVYFIDIEK